MTRRETAYHVILPAATFGVYVAARLLRLVPAEFGGIAFSEHGVFEIGTAVFFALAAFSAGVLCVRSRGVAPNVVRFLFLLYALVACWVALEEISYGQRIFGWKTPIGFAQLNAHHETNLHNMLGNRVSHWLDDCATVVTIGGFIALPVLARILGWTSKPDHWAYYLLPRVELITVVLLAQLCQFLYDAKSLKSDNVQFHLGWNEIREYYWGLLSVLYVLIIWQRLIGSHGGTTRDRCTLGHKETSGPNLQAA